MGSVLDSFNNPPDVEALAIVLPGQNPNKPWDGADVYGNNAFFNNLVAETMSVPFPPIGNGSLSPLVMLAVYCTASGSTPVPTAALTPQLWVAGIINPVPGYFTAVVGQSTITVSQTGIYVISCAAQFPASSAGTRRDLTLLHNGASFFVVQCGPISASVGAQGVLTWTAQLNAGDTVGVALFQDSGTTMPTGTGLNGLIIITLIADVP